MRLPDCSATPWLLVLTFQQDAYGICFSAENLSINMSSRGQHFTVVANYM